MAGKQTLLLIKPHAVRDNKAGEILSMLCNAGFRIIALKMTRLNGRESEEFYNEHTGKYFFEPLVEMMSGGPIIAAILFRNDAVAELRSVVGKTNPEEAAPGTVRKIFGISMRENAVHASDCDANAQRECSFFFSDDDIYHHI
ncbi:MAG: nucleoside-diphosphate kinase [Marinilabiliales bacterium]|nr:MAG: nucleoside-diphosphate kinase [Marinilabiliales bacterium]